MTNPKLTEEQVAEKRSYAARLRAQIPGMPQHLRASVDIAVIDVLALSAALAEKDKEIERLKSVLDFEKRINRVRKTTLDRAALLAAQGKPEPEGED